MTQGKVGFSWKCDLSDFDTIAATPRWREPPCVVAVKRKRKIGAHGTQTAPICKLKWKKKEKCCHIRGQDHVVVVVFALMENRTATVVYYLLIFLFLCNPEFYPATSGQSILDIWSPDKVSGGGGGGGGGELRGRVLQWCRWEGDRGLTLSRITLWGTFRGSLKKNLK